MLAADYAISLIIDDYFRRMPCAYAPSRYAAIICRDARLMPMPLMR